MKWLLASFLLLPLLAAPTRARACLWDQDTLKMEQKRFPDALQLITGHFLRHSRAFYEWRVADRRKQLEKRPNDLALRDDMAVALDKAGQHHKAIEVMKGSLKLEPGRYETLANLGTFHVHSGHFEEGLKFIEMAIEVNADAHFGREIYQQRLVEWVRSVHYTLPLSLPLEGAIIGGRPPFSRFLEEQRGRGPKGGLRRLTLRERKKAIAGVLGMMRFGNHDSPVLLEALASLLAYGWKGRDRELDGKQLAARALLKASYEARDPHARERYRKMVEVALRGQESGLPEGESMKMREVEKPFRAELMEAAWFSAEVHADEARWISEGIDVDAAFSKKYFEKAP